MRCPISFRVIVACPWTRRWLLAVPAAAFVLALLAGSVSAEEAPSRPIRVAPIVGSRIFAEPLKLYSEFAFGARVSMGLSDRVTVAVDASHSSPVRKTTGSSMSFGEIRLLTTVAILRGRVQPYALAGLGGQFFNFFDAPGAAGLIFAGGLGVEFEPVERWSVFAEGSADFYRASFTMSNSPSFLTASPRQTLATGVLTLGVQYEF